MLYINGQHVDLSNTKADYKFSNITKDFRDTIALLRMKHGDFVLFKSIYEPRLDAVTKIRRPHKAITISYKANVHSEETGSQKWVYSPEGATIKDGVATPTEVCFVMKNGSITLPLKEESELIYFLTKSGKYQSKKIYIYDENEKQDEIASKRAQDVKLSEAIYSESSPLNNLETITAVARKWGIPGLEKMRLSTIKNLLYNKVIDAEEQKRRNMTDAGLDAFLQDIDEGASLVIGEDVQLAKEKGLLTFSKTSNEWLLIVEKGQKPWSVMRVDSSETPQATQSLLKYLQRNPKDAERLSLVVSGNAKIDHGKVVEGAPPIPEDMHILLINADNVMEEDNYALLQKTYAHYGLGSPAGKGKDFLKEKLLEHFERQAQEAI